MFQTGYLTIDSLDQASGLYKLKGPNQEVKSTLEKYLLAIFINSDLNSTELLVHKFFEKTAGEFKINYAYQQLK